VRPETEPRDRLTRVHHRGIVVPAVGFGAPTPLTPPPRAPQKHPSALIWLEHWVPCRAHPTGKLSARPEPDLARILGLRPFGGVSWRHASSQFGLNAGFAATWGVLWASKGVLGAERTRNGASAPIIAPAAVPDPRGVFSPSFRSRPGRVLGSPRREVSVGAGETARRALTGLPVSLVTRVTRR
jgi:hypothetical protein